MKVDTGKRIKRSGFHADQVVYAEKGLNMKRWKITGFIATIVIILSIPLYLHEDTHMSLSYIQMAFNRSRQLLLSAAQKCMDCHKKEYDKWQDSHHDHAMDVADDETVLGDFNNAVFEIHGVTSRFYRKDGKFFVHTQGPDGKMGEFEITHTFGWYPLQQYLVPFPGGRLQCLPIAWDVREKKWYHLYPKSRLTRRTGCTGPMPDRTGTACVPNAIPPI